MGFECGLMKLWRAYLRGRSSCRSHTNSAHRAETDGTWQRFSVLVRVIRSLTTAAYYCEASAVKYRCRTQCPYAQQPSSFIRHPK